MVTARPTGWLRQRHVHDGSADRPESALCVRLATATRTGEFEAGVDRTSRPNDGEVQVVARTHRHEWCAARRLSLLSPRSPSPWSSWSQSAPSGSGPRSKGALSRTWQAAMADRGKTLLFVFRRVAIMGTFVGAVVLAIAGTWG